MKVRVYNEKPVEDKVHEFIVRLVQLKEGVKIVLVHEDGTEVTAGSLFKITCEMKLLRYGSLNDELGLPLDGSRRLELVRSLD